MNSTLFTPFDVGPVSLNNRIVVSPMCQYSADDGSASDWHLQHLMQLAVSGAGLIMLEATAVERGARITHGCLGLYSDSNEAHLARVLAAARKVAPKGTRFGIQLAHAGRKGSTQLPWEGGKPLTKVQDSWETVAPSAAPFAEGWHTPRALAAADLVDVISAYTRAAERAAHLGFDVVELHFGYGYLAHQFLSPLANHRGDEYGGSRENRMRLPLRIARAVRDALPDVVALGARISATDWVEGGADVADAIAFASMLREIGMRYVCVASGAVAPATIPIAPSFLAPFAAQIRAAAKIATRVSGMIATPEQAETIVATGQADMVALARALLDNPRWVWHAAARFGAHVPYPPQYQRSRPDLWAGAELARPRS